MRAIVLILSLIVTPHTPMVLLLAMMLLLLLLLLLLLVLLLLLMLLLLVAHLATVTHPHPLGWRLVTGVIIPGP